MAKNDGIVAVYALHGRLALAMKQGKGFKTMWVDIPDNIIKDDVIVAKNLFATFMKGTMRENGFKSKKAAYVLGSDIVLMRNVNIPRMTEEQVRVNLPFEFRDFIKGELKGYIFDYAYRPQQNETSDSEVPDTMNLLAAAVPTDHYEELTEIFQVAGMKLVKAVPEICVLESLLKLYEDEEEFNKERCFLDIGNKRIRMQVFKKGCFKLSHVIDIGEKHIVRTIADEMSVDMSLARTYLRTNYQDCTKLPRVMESYNDIANEVIKGFNFYEMSDMSSRLNDVVLYGSGAMIEPLVEILEERIGMNVVTMNDTFPSYNTTGDLNITAGAMGALLD
ncbi:MULTISPECIES: pilus assembly protein PilM [unclassified Butyrivibrio]|uniref:pilus assembly protein PilM n=1 Tax=unclassified Butyrivibrio TaxID=2639466 RepID=UPI00041BC517|nr:MULTISPECIES: pilus assembly protein PilM [unclassified Butyrivibrio]